MRYTYSDDFFRAIVQNSAELITIFDENHVLQYASPSVEPVLGYRPDELAGAPVSDLIHARDVPAVESAVSMLPAARGLRSARVRYRCKAGGWKRMEVTLTNLLGDPDVRGIVCMAREIPETDGVVLSAEGSADDRGSDPDQLKMLSLVASKTTNGVIITDAEDRIEWVNAAFTRVTGYPLSKIRGTVPASFLQGPETSPAAALRIEHSRRAKLSFTEEIVYHTITGDPIWFRIEVTPLLDQEGNLVRTITIQTDISDRKRSEQEMYKLTQDLSRQNQDLQQFTYMVSHNLRSPIANCRGLLDLLSGIDKTDPFFDDCLKMLHSSVAHLERITADMNSILTFRDENSQSGPESINLRSFLKDTVKDFQDFRSCSLTQINNKVSPELFVTGNRGFLHNIFTNLISNSIKYRSDERNLQIDLHAWKDDGQVFITLQDNGLGFDSDKLKNQLFKLYKRFHTDREEGRGIGLYLVKTAVEAMNGKINVESTPGVGTKFMISIPSTS